MSYRLQKLRTITSESRELVVLNGVVEPPKMTPDESATLFKKLEEYMNKAALNGEEAYEFTVFTASYYESGRPFVFVCASSSLVGYPNKSSYNSYMLPERFCKWYWETCLNIEKMNNEATRLGKKHFIFQPEAEY